MQVFPVLSLGNIIKKTLVHHQQIQMNIFKINFLFCFRHYVLRCTRCKSAKRPVGCRHWGRNLAGSPSSKNAPISTTKGCSCPRCPSPCKPTWTSHYIHNTVRTLYFLYLQCLKELSCS